ncbi:cuticle protein 2-like [Trichoplusia ni]|uniref:Cuticle protein 2-like n=1 Tax=Trichoplusia ni TaxID=7111 RepID=A0A7E5WAI7_TRINI|nr:cuticle protein 2-like [Trichoplusia ni]
MKLLAPITALIAAASAGQIYTGQTAESYAKAAELYQSGLEHQQNGLYSDLSQAPQVFASHDAAYNSRPSGEKTAKILSYNMENNGHEYKYSYETDNGIRAEESGHLSEGGTTTHGAYSYTGDDGKVYTVTYTADEHGFHPQGAHLPTPPPIPESIQNSLAQNAREEASGVFDDGHYKEQGQYKEHISQYKEIPDHGVTHSYPQYENFQPITYEEPSHVSGAELAYHGHH